MVKKRKSYDKLLEENQALKEVVKTISALIQPFIIPEPNDISNEVAIVQSNERELTTPKTSIQKLTTSKSNTLKLTPKSILKFKSKNKVTSSKIKTNISFESIGQQTQNGCNLRKDSDEMLNYLQLERSAKTSRNTKSTDKVQVNGNKQVKVNNTTKIDTSLIDMNRVVKISLDRLPVEKIRNERLPLKQRTIDRQSRSRRSVAGTDASTNSKVLSPARRPLTRKATSTNLTELSMELSPVRPILSQTASATKLLELLSPGRRSLPRKAAPTNLRELTMDERFKQLQLIKELYNKK